MLVEYVAPIVSLAGMALVARHEYRYFGFIICLIGNILWLWVELDYMRISYFLLFIGYFVCNTIGMHDEYATWKKIRKTKQTFKK